MPTAETKNWRENPETTIHEFLKTNVIVSIINPIGRIIYVNDKFCKVTGYNKKEIFGEVDTIFKSEIHSNPIYKDMWSTIKRGSIWKGVLSTINKNGQLIWLDTTIVPIKNNKGKIHKYVAMHIEVTDNVERNFNSIDKETRLRNFKENIPKVVLSINQYGEILNINRGIFNLSIEGVIGKSLYNFINPVFHDMVKNIVNLVFEYGEPSQYETTDFNSKGEQIFFISQIGPVVNKKGKVVSATISTQEVNEIKDIKQELIDNEEKYRSIFQSINTGILIVVDQLGEIVEWNKGAESAFGYSEFEIIGQPLTKLISTLNRKESFDKIFEVIKSLDELDTSPNIEMQVQNKNGKEFPVEFVLSKILRGKKVFYCAMMLDISKRKNLENKLIQKSNDLELFFYRSAHDLRAPFSTAHGLLTLLKEEKTINGVQTILPMLEDTLMSAKTLSDDLMEVSMIGSENSKISSIDFHEIIGKILIMFSNTLKFDDVKFNIDIDQSIPFYSNARMISSVFQNLIQNAIKYSKRCSKTHEPYIDVRVKTTIKQAIITICDNGLGINNESINKIFDLYYRGDNGDIPGNGLGLYIVKNIIENLEGKIKVISDGKSGTCFEITLPKI